MSAKPYQKPTKLSSRGSALKLDSSAGSSSTSKSIMYPKLTIDPSAKSSALRAKGSETATPPVIFPICFIPPPPAAEFEISSEKSSKSLPLSQLGGWLSSDPQEDIETPTNEEMYFDWNGSEDKFNTPTSSRSTASESSYRSPHSRSSPTPSLSNSTGSTPSSTWESSEPLMFHSNSQLPYFLPSEFMKSLSTTPPLHPPQDFDANVTLPPIMFFYTPFLPPMFMNPEQFDHSKAEKDLLGGALPLLDVWPPVMYPLTADPKSAPTSPDCFLDNLMLFNQFAFDPKPSCVVEKKSSPFLPDNILPDSPSICPDQLKLTPDFDNEVETAVKSEDEDKVKDDEKSEIQVCEKRKRSASKEDSGREINTAKDQVIKTKKARISHPAIFKCDYDGCGKVFTRQYNLRSHMKMHTGEQLYACQVCNQKFIRGHDLRRHLRLHTNERPFSCPKCEKGFARSDALKRHITIDICVPVSSPKADSDAE